MSQKVSIIITSFKRPHLLNWGLYSLAKQSIPFDFETLVLNDGIIDETEAVCKKYASILNLRYIFTGQRNLGGEVIWRVPGFAYNIGAKLSCGEIFVLSCAEMFHLNDSIALLVNPVLADKKTLAIPSGIDDRNGSFLKLVEINQGDCDYSTLDLNDYPKLNTRYPFLMSISRDEYFSIGGYDEDFIGIAWDDNDLVGRLLSNGCSFLDTVAAAVHLYHERNVYGKSQNPAFLLNQSLYRQRRKQIIRNLNREWGKL